MGADDLRSSGARRRPTWRQRSWVLAWMALANVALACAIGSSYLDHGPEHPTPRQRVFLVLGLVSCAAIVQAVPWLLLELTALAVRGRRVLGALAAFLFTLAQLLLYCDTLIFGIFRYHFNGLVWNVLTTPGADESVHVGEGEIGLVVGATVLVLALEYLLFQRLARRQEERAARAERPPFLARPLPVAGLSVLPALVLFAGQYGWSDLTHDRSVMTLSQLYPIYPRITFKHWARDLLGYEAAVRPAVRLPSDTVLLRYPHEQVELPPGGPRPNLVVLVVDSLRCDMLDPRWMPRASALAADGARVFRDHLSGGNGTRFGLFSMLYGLHGSYWHFIYREQRSPVLIDALVEAGYDTSIWTATSLNYPEMRSTAFAGIQDDVHDRLTGGRPGGRDDAVVEAFCEWIEGRASGAPFFTLVLLDAPHQKYSFPEEHARQRPYAEDISYRELAAGCSPEDVAATRNRYRNAVHYADASVGRLLDALARAGELEQSVVVVTGDHGEEFFEHGFFGHTSNLTRAQLQVPLVLRGPGVPPGDETRPTSHADVPATLLELCGLDPALRERYTLGASLLDPPAERRRVVSGWDYLGLEAADGHVLKVPMETYAGGIEVYDADWKLVLDDAAILRAEGATLGRLALECRRFLR